MLDITFIRQHPDQIKEVCRQKQVDVDVDKLLEVDKERRDLLSKVEEMRAAKNRASEEIARTKDEEKKKSIISDMRELDDKSDELEEELKKLEERFHSLMLRVPNIIFDDVPAGKDETDNKVIRKWGGIPDFNFTPKDHLDLGESLGIIDVKKASEVSGSRFGYLKREAVFLEWALINYTYKILTSEEEVKKIANSVEEGYSSKAFIPVIPPDFIRPEVYTKMARLSKEDEEERYYLSRDNLYLIGSAEHTLGPLHMDEILPEMELPIRYLGFSTSFRREAGSYGKDTRGIFRVHQFDKIEMESFALPENSLKEQKFFIGIQEYLMQSLEIPYQVVMICTGDMGAPDARQVDIEAWLPGQNRYRETHTADLMTDYQARRLNTRVRRKGGDLEFVHMNDATAFAIGRTLIAIIENYQQKDGSIKVPEVLLPYVPFKKID